MITPSRLLRALHNNRTRLHTERSIRATPTRAQGQSPRVMFCPSEGPEGASLLRAYNMAEALPQHGWVTGLMPAVIKPGQRARLIRRFDPDILVFQQCRHVLNDSALAPDRRIVLDTDDADFHLQLPGLVDRLERTSRAAAGVIVGSRYLQDWHSARSARTQVIWTGTPVTKGARTPHHTRAPILAWAQAKPLSYVQELDFVIALDARLRRSGSQHILRFYGIGSTEEEADLRARFDNAAHIQMCGPMGYAAFLRSLQEVAVGLSPIIAQSDFSRGKSFGKVLGYLDAMVPAIVSDQADHAQFFTGETGVVSNDIAVWAQAAQRLLADPEARNAMAQAAFTSFEEQLSIAAAARQTDRFLRSLLGVTETH